VNRDAFLTRVRDAAKAGLAHRVHLNDIPDGAGYVGVNTEKCAALAEEIDAVGGAAIVVDGLDAARDTLATLLNHYQAASALCWQHALLDRLKIRELLADANVAVHDYTTLDQLPPGDQRQSILAADVGISSVDFAVAETGTLTVCSKPGQERVISLVPPVHIAIIEESQIVPDLFDVFSQLGELNFDDLPSNVAFITGPSKTGDIELQLTTGVHGPGKWHAIILRAE
jgi:L-lactate utilization protein LutC